MIYNKPRDLSWRLLDSLGKKKSPKELPKVETKPDNLISKPQAAKKPSTPVNVDIILDGKPEFAKNMEIDENTVIDISTMPDIVGVPILQFPTAVPTQEESAPKKEIAPPPFTKPVEEKKPKNKAAAKATFTKGTYIARIAAFFVVFYAITVVSFYFIKNNPNRIQNCISTCNNMFQFGNTIFFCIRLQYRLPAVCTYNIYFINKRMLLISF